MAANGMIEKLKAGEVVIGVVNMYPASGIIEGMCKGWDFVFIDGQHGQMTFDTILPAVQAASGIGIDTVVRVPDHGEGVLCSYADLAPTAVLCPMVETVEQAQKLVKGLRFPPLGNRSYGGRRVIDLYGRHYYRDYEFMVIAQIESLEGVENAEAIAAVEGIDALFLGPDDMKIRLGLDVNTPIESNEKLHSAFDKVATAAKNQGVVCGGGAGNAEAITKLIGLGYRLFFCGGDIGFIRTGAGAQLEAMRQAVAGTDTGRAESSRAQY